MGLISGVFGAPLVPVKGFLRIARLIQQQVDQELHDPAAVRKQLEEIDRAASAGELSEQEQRAAEEMVIERMRQ